MKVQQRKWVYVTVFLAAILLYANILEADFAIPFEITKVGDISEAHGYVIAMDTNVEECTGFWLSQQMIKCGQLVSTQMQRKIWLDHQCLAGRLLLKQKL